MTTINLNLLKAVAIAAGKEVTRYYLQCVSVEIQENSVLFVATDSHRLIAARQQTEPDQAPCKALIPLDFINNIKIQRKIDFAELSIEGETVKITYAGATYSSQTLDATFPDWRRVVPKQHDEKPAHFNPAYLNDFAKAMKLANTGELPCVNHNGGNAALVHLGQGEKFDWFGVIMPIRDKANRGVPDTIWAE